MTQALAERIERTDQLPLAPPAAASPMLAMMSDAIQKGHGIDVIRELKSMAKEFEQDEATRAFNVAFASFKAEAVTVLRNKDVTDGPLKGRKYAELHAFVDAATPALAAHGLSHSWQITRDEKDWIEVTCIIEHALGGKKQVSMGGPPDTGGAKNPLQARISTVTYLERATLKAACGLAEKGDDDDGAGGGFTDALTEEQAAEIQELIEVAVDELGNTTVEAHRAAFLKHMQVEAIADILAKDFRRAVVAINSTRPRR